MAQVKIIANTFCGGLFLESGSEYEVTADDAIRLVGLGKAIMLDGKKIPSAKKKSTKTKIVDAIKKKK
jgi:hypothetical protein